MGRYLLDPLTLIPGQVCFFYTLISQVRETQLIQSFNNLLDEKEKQKINRRMSEKGRHARLVARALARQVLAWCTGTTATAVQFTENRFGKPELAPGITDQPIRFNLSCTNDLVACAVTLGHDIGVDIENVHRQVDLSIADRFFSNQEAEAISQADAGLKTSLFFRFWTLKEAFVKATGRGIATGLDQFCFVMDQDDIQVVFHPAFQGASGQACHGQDHDRPGPPGHWQFFQFAPVPGYMAAVAVNKKNGPMLTLSVHPWVWQQVQESTLARRKPGR
jgi:4'-phosphopantetheinyl transferase